VIGRWDREEILIGLIAVRDNNNEERTEEEAGS
jgi:hypothetical protein